MAGKTNYEALKKALVQKRQKQADREGWWKPNPGRYLIRVLPPWDGSESWYVDYGVHYQILTNAGEGESSALFCPKKSQKLACFACDLVHEMWKGEEDERTKASQIKSQQRYACNIVVLAEPTKALRWSFGEKVFTQLTEIMMPPAEEGQESVMIPLDDPDRGMTLSVTVKSVRSKTGMVYNEMFIQPIMPPKPIPNKGVLAKLFNLTEWLGQQMKTNEEIRALMGGEVADVEETVPVEPEAAIEEAAAAAAIPEEAPPEMVTEEAPAESEPEPVEPAPAPKLVIKVPPKVALVAKPPVKPVQKPATTEAAHARPSPANVTAQAQAALRAKFAKQ